MTGQDVRATRIRLGLSTENFGLMLGTTGRMIRYYETGTPIPGPLSRLIRLSATRLDVRKALMEMA